ncbi:MFS transporter [Streptomyces sp. SPB4]|uniref:MFS transporter n=1 Tax=Streptomyces TaxID=1883 RepID=UPI0024758868|nr:MFS transporter [Streptomyces sp. SPB4]MDH6541102.1 EmrB/QacA subfamily drug resistance transporter [Streptomyces sp. SPB4]
MTLPKPPEPLKAPEPPKAPYPHRWAVLAVVLAAEVMDLLDATITGVAAPAIAADLGGGRETAQWLQAAYTLPFAVLLITAGRLGDRYGRRRLFLLGAAGFTLASVLCAAAPGPAWLVAARAAQGAAGALLLPQGFGIVKETFEGPEQARAFGLFGPVMGVCAVGGPVLGGLLAGADLFGTGWRLVFLVNLPLGLAALAGAVHWIPRTVPDGGARLDVPGMLLAGAASGALVYPLVQGRELGWPAWSIALAAAGPLGFWLFARHQRRRPSPLVAPTLLANRGYTGGIAVAVAFFAAFTGLMLVLSLFLQGPLGLSPEGAGYSVAPLALGIALTAGPAGGLAQKHGRLVIQAGIVLSALGLGLLAATAGGAVDGWRLLPGTFVTGLGMGLVIPPLFDVILAGVADHEVGSASGVLNAVQQLANAVGVALLVTVWSAFTDHGRGPGAALGGTALATAGLLAVALLLSVRLPRTARAQ